MHRARLMRGPEAACERWGSLLHALWDSVAGWQPHRIVSRLFIREAGLACEGRESDEAVVHEIASSLVSVHGLNPFTCPFRQSWEEEDASASTHIQARDVAARQGLRERQIEPRAW